MNEYMEKLINLYRLSMGINKKETVKEKEFLEWLFIYTNNGQVYLSWLKEKRLLEDISHKFAEVGKGEYDTITINQNTTLISPYIDIQSNSNNKIINSDFTVFNGIPLIVNGKPFEMVKGINTFMTQNPYDIDSMINWPGLYNYGNYDIIIGLYGNYFDKDKNSKIRFLKRMRERIISDCEIEEVSKKDTYCYVLSTKARK